MHIGDEYNYDDNFVRMTTIALCKVLTTRVRWINRWSDGKKIRVLLPFYTSFAGQERFMLDAFVDDIVSTRVELNTDQKQRGIVTFKGGTQRDDEFANPNQYLSKETKINNEFRSVISRTKAVPVSLNFDIMIKLDNEWEATTCYSKILDVLYNYRFFYISYFGLKIDAFFKLPPDTGIEIPREINLSSDNTIMIKFSLEVHTYYPVFDVISDDLEVCYNDDSIDWDFLKVSKPQEVLANIDNNIVDIFTNSKILDTNDNIISINSEGFLMDGKDNRRDADGNIIDKFGNVIYINGKIIDSNNNIIDINGTILYHNCIILDKNGQEVYTIQRESSTLTSQDIGLLKRVYWYNNFGKKTITEMIEEKKSAYNNEINNME